MPDNTPLGHLREARELAHSGDVYCATVHLCEAVAAMLGGWGEAPEKANWEPLDHMDPPPFNPSDPLKITLSPLEASDTPPSLTAMAREILSLRAQLENAKRAAESYQAAAVKLEEEADAARSWWEAEIRTVDLSSAPPWLRSRR